MLLEGTDLTELISLLNTSEQGLQARVANAVSLINSHAVVH